MAGDRKIWIDNIPAEDQEKCFSCSAQGRDYRGQIPIPLCKIARFQKELGGKPRLGQLAERGIETNLVPKDCPNGY